MWKLLIVFFLQFLFDSHIEESPERYNAKKLISRAVVFFVASSIGNTRQGAQWTAKRVSTVVRCWKGECARKKTFWISKRLYAVAIRITLQLSSLFVMWYKRWWNCFLPKKWFNVNSPIQTVRKLDDDSYRGSETHGDLFVSATEYAATVFYHRVACARSISSRSMLIRWLCGVKEGLMRRFLQSSICTSLYKIYSVALRPNVRA